MSTTLEEYLRALIRDEVESRLGGRTGAPDLEGSGTGAPTSSSTEKGDAVPLGRDGNGNQPDQKLASPVFTSDRELCDAVLDKHLSASGTAEMRETTEPRNIDSWKLEEADWKATEAKLITKIGNLTVERDTWVEEYGRACDKVDAIEAEIAKHAHLFVAPPSVTWERFEAMCEACWNNRGDGFPPKWANVSEHSKTGRRSDMLAALAAGGIGVQESPRAE